MRRPGQRLRILALEPSPHEFVEFYRPLQRAGTVDFYPRLAPLLDAAREEDFPPGAVAMLCDLPALAALDADGIRPLIELRSRIPVGITTAVPPEDHIELLARHGFLQTIVKVPPIPPPEALHLVECVADPASGFGLFNYLTSTIEMYNLSMSTMEEKNRCVERVINHFATSGFDIHELFDVRLILEEAINNAFFHSFRLPSGEKKYNPRTFRSLDPSEKIRIEYGTSAEGAGFTVSDNAGTLQPAMVLDRLQSQVLQTGTFDIRGRGLHLSRLLSTALIVNIEEQARTQIIALFDDRRKLQRPKSILVNHLPARRPAHWAGPHRDRD